MLPCVALLITLLPNPAVPQDERVELAKVQGTWHVTTAEENGDRVPKERREKVRLTMVGSHFKFEDGKTALEGSFSVGGKNPKTFDAFAELAANESFGVPGIYKMENDTLTICFSRAKKRPAQFKTEPGQNVVLLVLRRQAGDRVPH